MFEWMAWTLPVAVFFTSIVLMLVGMTLLANGLRERWGRWRLSRGEVDSADDQQQNDDAQDDDKCTPLARHWCDSRRNRRAGRRKRFRRPAGFSIVELIVHGLDPYSGRGPIAVGSAVAGNLTTEVTGD